MWSTSLRDVTCCSHNLGIPPHAKELMLQDSAFTLGTTLPTSHREAGQATVQELPW